MRRRRQVAQDTPASAQVTGILEQLPQVEELELRLESLDAERARVAAVLKCLRGLQGADLGQAAPEQPILAQTSL